MTDDGAKRDPISTDPLPLPGSGLFEKVVPRLVWTALFGGVLVGVLLSLFFVMLLQAMGFMPWPPIWNWVLIIGLIVIWALQTSVLRKLERQTDNELLGLRGERCVGQMLEGLRSQGYVPLHDLLEVSANGAKYNIDHVLVGPAGVFVIETKTRRKPARGKAVVEYDGSAVKVGGPYRDEGPIRQVIRNAESVRQILGRGLDGSDPPIQAVVLYPGWYVQAKHSGCEVWVLNEKAFPRWLAESVLSPDDIDYYVQRLIERRTR